MEWMVLVTDPRSDCQYSSEIIDETVSQLFYFQHQSDAHSFSRIRTLRFILSARSVNCGCQ